MLRRSHSGVFAAMAAMQLAGAISERNMKVTSALLTSMSGKIGGAVASRARGGVQYFRKLVTPANPRTFLQTAIRNAVSSVSAAWRDLVSEADQQAWWDLADDIGSSATGKTLFSRVNQPRIYANNADLYSDWQSDPLDPLELILQPPVGMSLVGPPTPTITIDASANTLQLGPLENGSWTDDASPSTPAMVYIYASPGQQPSRFSRSHPYRMIRAWGVTNGVNLTLDPIDLAALDMPTITGYVMYVKLYVQSVDGKLTVPVEQRVTIVA